ncbi:MAG: YebC/PmpR family DNA-binding transcriptional regulator [Acholeplasmataceae bacterium]
MGRAFEVRKVAMGKTAAAKSKLYARYGKEVLMAAKSGIPDPEVNIALKQIIDRAKRDQVPSDVIKRAIDKAKGGTDENYSPTRYEGFGPGGSMFIVECLTDNVNRTIAEVRNCFTKTGGKLGINGSVVFQFEHQAVFTLKDMTEDEILEVAIEKDLNIKHIEQEEDGITIYGDATDYSAIKQGLDESNPELEYLTDAIMWIPTNDVTLTSDDAKQSVDKLMNLLDQLDDVQDVYHNINL